MNIKIVEFVKGAENAQGIVVIIDVFRAFSVACYAFASGVSEIIATDGPDKAFRMRDIYPGALLAGEREEKKIEGYDFGNSPSEIIQADLSNKRLIHTTTAGTRGIVSATEADLVLTGSLVNAAAIVKYIKKLSPENVTLVAMGYRSVIRAQEDILCAEMIANGLEGDYAIFGDRIAELKYTSGSRFFKISNLAFSPPEDFFLCTDADRFDFVIKAEPLEPGIARLQKIMNF